MGAVHFYPKLSARGPLYNLILPPKRTCLLAPPRAIVWNITIPMRHILELLFVNLHRDLYDHINHIKRNVIPGQSLRF